MSVKTAGFREPGLRVAGEVSEGGGGGSSHAADITIVDAGSFYTSGNVEGALQEAFTAINLRMKTADLASTAAGKGASLIGTNDASLLIGGVHPTVEASLVSIADDVDTALGLLTPSLPITSGGTGQTTAAAAFDALTVTAPSIASAATVNLALASCPGHYVIITGNTGPITSFGTAPAGTERILRFASNPTVTHNATSLILPGAADITMAVGDVLFLHSLGSGNWRATSYLRAASLPAYANDLASTASGKGGSLIGLQDAGGYFTIKTAEAALQQLGPLLTGGATSLLATTTDAGTNTAPDLINIGHRSSGTPAANFGLTVGRELDSSAKNRRRALAEVTKWTTATDGAETASHTFQLRLAGALTDTLTLSPTTSNFPVNGTAAAPALTIGTAGDLIGFYRSSSQELGIAAGGVRLARWYTGSPGGLLADTTFIGPLGSAPNPTFCVNGTTGGSGLYGLASGFAMSILNSDTFIAQKSGNAFKFTALVPGSNNAASTEAIGLDFAMQRTSTWANGALTTQREVLFRAPTYAFTSASTVTTTATVAISDAPLAGSNATLTNRYSLWTQAGAVRFDLADAATTTAPDALVQRHTTSGTAAAGFGLLNATELQSAAGNVRRVLTDAVSLVTATDAAEESRREISLMQGGTLQSVVSFGFFPGAALPAIFFGAPANQKMILAQSGQIRIYDGSTQCAIFGSSGVFIGGNSSSVSLTSTGLVSASGTGFAATPSASSSGVTTKFAVTPGADTGTTASTEAFDLDINLSRTRTWATGALTTQRAMLVRAPTYAFVGASTITNAATMAISGAPIAGTNATITNAYALWTQAGIVRHDLADAATSTAPDGFVQRHTTSGTAAASFGITNAMELQSAAGNIRRVMTDATILTTATDGAEVASRTVQMMNAGALATALVASSGNAGFTVSNTGSNSGTLPQTAGTLRVVQSDSSLPTITMWQAGSLAFTLRARVGGTSAEYLATEDHVFYGSLNATNTVAKFGTTNGVLFNRALQMTPNALSSGVQSKFQLQPAADTGTTASTEAFDVDFDFSRTRTWATGAITTQRFMRVKGPTIAFSGASVVTSAATFAIESAPAAGTNATITNAYSFWVQAGASRLDGNFGFQKAPVAQQSTTGTATGFTAGAGTNVTDASTFTGGTGATAYRISDIVLALKNYGWLAA